MRMNTGLVVVTLGAVIRYAIDADWDYVDREIVGLILLIVGAIAFLAAAARDLVMSRAAGARLTPHAPAAPLPPSAPPPSAPTPAPPPGQQPPTH